MGFFWNDFGLIPGFAALIAIAFGVTGIGPIFVAFMCTIDIPMYWHRYHADEARGAEYLSLSEGFVDAMRCRRIDRTWEVWAEEMPWMTVSRHHSVVHSLRERVPQKIVVANMYRGTSRCRFGCRSG